MAKETTRSGSRSLEPSWQRPALPWACSDPQHPDVVGRAVLAVLGVALDALREPALIVDRGGEVVCSNASVRALMGGGDRVIRWSPAPASSPGAEGIWDVTSLAPAGWPNWSLVILRTRHVPSQRRWNLTARQTEVLQLVARGMTNASIAQILGIHLGTVEFHVAAIFNKVGVSSRAALIATLIGG